MRHVFRIGCAFLLINAFAEWVMLQCDIKAHHDYAIGLFLLFLAMGILVLREASGLFNKTEDWNAQ